MKPRDYCCCAIPVINTGIYLTLLEQFVLSLLVAILALATPDLVGASVPGYGKVILAIICFIACGVQLFGFFGVFKEKSIMFRRYTTIHIMITTAAFSVALVWIIISATKHNTAKADCLTDFFSNTTSTSVTGDEGDILCNIFTWVDVGLMGGLWIILAIMQFYLYTVISGYGTGQRKDQESYRHIYSPAGNDSGIPLTNRVNDPWDARPSFDEDAQAPMARGNHKRFDSDASVSTIMAEKQQQESNMYNGAGVQRQNTYQSAQSAYSQPPAAHTQEPQPTPAGYDNYYSQTTGYRDDIERPGHIQSHPAEGMFGRKTARLQKYDPRPIGYGGYDF